MRLRAGLPLAMAAFLTAACNHDPPAPETTCAAAQPGGASGNSTKTAGDTGCKGTEEAYPAGPYGSEVGDVVPNLKFSGLRNPKAVGYDINQSELITLSDFYNPTRDPTKPRVLVMTSSVRWCSFCKEEASQSMKLFKHWNPKGVTFLNALMEGEIPGEPATHDDLRLWTRAYKLEYPTVLDPKPAQVGVFFNLDTPPFNMVIDTTTMKLLFKTGGMVYFGPENPTLKAAVGE